MEDFIAKAGIGGGVCAMVSASLNPIDVTKIRMQNESRSSSRYSGLIDAMKKIFREEGISGLSKGIEPSMCREVFYSSIRMGAYEPIRSIISHVLGQEDHHTSAGVKFVSALFSGGIGSAIANPFDLVKTRFQATLPEESIPYGNSTLVALKDIARSDGVLSGLYRGWVATSGRAAALTSAQLGSYDVIKNDILIAKLGIREGFGAHLCASMMAGVIATTAANPFDVIKTRYMADAKGIYKSLSDCVIHTFRKDGLSGFLRGWVPSYFRIGPHTVLSLLLIEQVRKLVGLDAL